MDPAELETIYGPPALDAPHKPGETLVYDDNGSIENGEILYAAAQNDAGQPDLHYIVSPAIATFPTPVWPSQVITAM